MTKALRLFTICALVSPVFADTPAPTVNSLYQQGRAAEKSGDVAGASQFYTSALKLDPSNPDVRYSLGQLKLNADTITTKARETKFGAVMIPVIQLEDATFKESLAAFSALVAKESKNEVSPNFVIEDPKNRLAVGKITMTLKNVPAQAVMKYLIDQANARVRYDEHAVVISPR